MTVMKRLYILISIVAAALLTGSCIQDIFFLPSVSEGKEVECTLNFGSPMGPRVSVSTKGNLGVMRESNIFNLYLLIFDSNGKKFYGHYFTGDELGQTSLSNYWTVNNMTSDSGSTSGSVHFKTTAHQNCTLVAIANLNPNDLDISAGLLSTIKNYSGLQAIIASQIRSEVSANSGYFMMTAEETGVNIGESDNLSEKQLKLERLYAKVTFNVRINPGAPIYSFTPDRWQVVNVPTCCWLLPQNSDVADASDEFFTTDPVGFDLETLTPNPATDYYQDGKNTPVSIHSFTFYMMENRKSPTTPSGGWTYAERERESGSGSSRVFLYANQLATYVVLTGKIVMHNVDATNASLEAIVKYKIHLGNFSANLSDFDVLRNHSYVYNIYINGAEDIRTEVEDHDENEPGATGQVVIADEVIYTSDCHYSTQVVSFHAKYLNDLSNMSWSVQTPFNPDGIRANPDGSNLDQMDYKWVEFMLNKKVNGTYTNKRVIYKPHDFDWSSPIGQGYAVNERTKYAYELVDYLKAQKALYDIDTVKTNPANPQYDPDYVWQSDFDNGLLPDGTTDPDGPKISFTAFVDEFYYTENPINHTYNTSIWKDYVVNQPMRRMHIMASSKTSDDGESSVVGSSLTIQQRSIQTIYAIEESADLKSAWGMEFVDDSRFETGLTQYWKTKNEEPSGTDGDMGNTSQTNGRLNTLKLWGILDKYGNRNSTTLRWDDFLNLHSANETAQLWRTSDPDNTYNPKRDYYYLRYSCLSRNRDNDGNEIIDPDEIRWYMASDLQLIGVFLGSYGIEGDARLYQYSAAEQAAGGTNWRQHVVASNRYEPQVNMNSNRYARVIWAEEGMNGSSLNYTNTGQTSSFSTRCVRNLGYYIDDGVRKDITDSEPEIEPDFYIKTVRKHLNADGTISDYPETDPSNIYDNRTFYDIDCSRINVASLRANIDHELVGHDENSRMACLPSHFETSPLINGVDISGKTNYSFNNHTYNLTTYTGLNDYLDAAFGELDTNFSVCPHGYRLPNVREISVIWNELSNFTTGDLEYLGKDNATAPSRTYWSKGPKGSNKVSDGWGWGMIKEKMLMALPNGGKHSVKMPRCVRDI